jgi:hypothetical protein
LTVHQNGTAAAGTQIETMSAFTETQFHAVVHQTFSAHSFGSLCPVYQCDSPLLEHSGSNSTEHVLPAAPFENDAVNPLEVQQLRQQ